MPERGKSPSPAGEKRADGSTSRWWGDAFVSAPPFGAAVDWARGADPAVACVDSSVRLCRDLYRGLYPQ